MLKPELKSCVVDDVSIRWKWSKLNPLQNPHPLTDHDNMWVAWPLSRPVPGSCCVGLCKKLAKWTCVVSAVSALWKFRNTNDDLNIFDRRRHQTARWRKIASTIFLLIYSTLLMLLRVKTVSRIQRVQRRVLFVYNALILCHHGIPLIRIIIVIY